MTFTEGGSRAKESYEKRNLLRSADRRNYNYLLFRRFRNRGDPLVGGFGRSVRRQTAGRRSCERKDFRLLQNLLLLYAAHCFRY